MSYPPCAGIIVFNCDKTILVSTDTGNLSFPKGSRKNNESDIQTAWRELEEETGLTKDDVKLVDGLVYDEKSSKGFPSVRYFVANLVNETKELHFENPNELLSVGWYDVNDILKKDKIKEERKAILMEAYTNNTTI